MKIVRAQNRFLLRWAVDLAGYFRHQPLAMGLRDPGGDSGYRLDRRAFHGYRPAGCWMPDIFKGHERALAYMGVIMALAPMLAPVFGGWVLTWFSWRWVFVIQAAIAVIGWIGVLRMPETLKTPSANSVRETAGIYFELLANRRYLGFALMMSIIVLPHFAFIGGSADIYITRFGLSEQVFGYFFALNAMALMAGSFACMRLLGRLGSQKLLTIGFVGILAGSAAMLTRWLPGPWGLALPMVVISFSFGLSRPPSNNLVLEQVDRHAGAASSLLIFIYFLLGAFAMWFIALDWADKVRTIGLLGAISGGAMLALWLLFAKRAGTAANTGR